MGLGTGDCVCLPGGLRYELEDSTNLLSRVRIIQARANGYRRGILLRNRALFSMPRMNGSSLPVRQRAQPQPQVREHVGPSLILFRPTLSVALRLWDPLDLAPFLALGVDRLRCSLRDASSRYVQGR